MLRSGLEALVAGDRLRLRDPTGAFYRFRNWVLWAVRGVAVLLVLQGVVVFFFQALWGRGVGGGGVGGLNTHNKSAKGLIKEVKSPKPSPLPP